MRFLVATVRKDLRRRLADPVALSIWIGLPALIGFLISLLSGNGEDVPTARILLVNQDDSAVTGLLVDMLAQGGAVDGLAFEFDIVDLETGMDRIGDRDGTALLILPPRFGAALLADEPTTLTLITDPTEAILPSIVVEGLEIFREGAFYAQRVLGEPVRELAAGPPASRDVFDNAAVAALAVAVNGRLAAARDLIDPPIFEIEFGGGEDAAPAEAADPGTDIGFVRFLLPGIILMSILFIAQGMSDDFWTEKDGGTLGRAVATPQPLTAFVAGKLVAGLLLIALVATAALSFAAAVFGVPLGRVPLAVAWCTYAGTALLGLFLFVSMLGTSHRTANLITMMILFPLMMIGGSFFPFEAMPAWMRAVGVWTPNGMAVVQLDDMLFEVPGLRSVTTAAAVIGATAGVSLWLCVRRAKRLVAL